MAGKRVLSDAVPAVFPLFATKKAKREITTGAWTKYKGSLLVGDYGTPEASRKIAAFDLVCGRGGACGGWVRQNVSCKVCAAGWDNHMHKVGQAIPHRQE